MFRPFELFIGLRYTRAKRRNHFISFISVTSMVGVAVGVMALITVLSVMNGFEKELRQRILGMTAHATVQGFEGGVGDWRSLRGRLLEDDRVVDAAPYIRGEAMLRRGDRMTGGLLRGVQPSLENTVSRVGRHMVEGSLGALEAGEYRIVLGADLADKLGVGKGDYVDLLVPETTVTPAGVIPRMRRFEVVGLFEVGHYYYDSSLALIHLDDAAKLYRHGDGVTGIRLELRNMFAAPAVAGQLGDQLPAEYFVSDWTRQHANFFRALQTEKVVMFVILALIVGVAAFNIVSTLVMMVTDKQGDIAILRTLGSTPGSVMVVFIIQGALIGVVGTGLGILAGVLLAPNVDGVLSLLEGLLGFELLPKNVYYISDLPSDMQMGDVVRVALLALGLSLVSTLYPAWRAARTEPAEALRYE